MANTLTSVIIENGNRDAVLRLTNESDGTNETLVMKVDATESGPYGVSIGGQTFFPYTHLKVRRIKYDIGGMTVRLMWDADTPQDFLVLGNYDEKFFDEFGGINVPPTLAGATGSILLSTLGAVSGAHYTIELEMRKDIAQVDTASVGYLFAESGDVIRTALGGPLEVD